MIKSGIDNFQFVKMQTKDIPFVCQIEKECFSHCWTEKLVSDEYDNKNSISFVCKDKNQVVGYVFLRYLFEEGEIMRICVKPEMRKRNIASHLMELCIEFAEDNGVEKVFLEVRKSNLGAIALYEKCGFSVYAQRSNYYSDNGEDALLMQKIINNN